MDAVVTPGVVTWFGPFVRLAERYAAAIRHATATRRQNVTAGLVASETRMK
jgi:hypothetical protein